MTNFSISIDDTCLTKVVTIEKRKHKNLSDLKKQIEEIFHLKSNNFLIKEMNDEKQFKKNKKKRNLTLKILKPVNDITINFNSFKILLNDCKGKDFTGVIDLLNKRNMYFSHYLIANLKFKIFDVEIPRLHFYFNCVPDNTCIYFDPPNVVCLKYAGFTFIFSQCETVLEAKKFLHYFCNGSDFVSISILTPSYKDLPDNTILNKKTQYFVQVRKCFYFFLVSSGFVSTQYLEYFTTVYDLKILFSQIFNNADRLTPENIIVFYGNQIANDNCRLIDLVVYNEEAKQYFIYFDFTRKSYMPAPLEEFPMSSLMQSKKEDFQTEIDTDYLYVTKAKPIAKLTKADLEEDEDEETEETGDKAEAESSEKEESNKEEEDHAGDEHVPAALDPFLVSSSNPYADLTETDLNYLEKPEGDGLPIHPTIMDPLMVTGSNPYADLTETSMMPVKFDYPDIEMKKKPIQTPNPKSSDADEEEDYEDIGKKKKARPPVKPKSSDDEEEDYEDIKKKKLAPKPTVKPKSGDSDSDGDFEDKKKKKTAPKPTVKPKSSDSDSDGDFEEKKKVKPKLPARSKLSESKAKKNEISIDFVFEKNLDMCFDEKYSPDTKIKDISKNISETYELGENIEIKYENNFHKKVAVNPNQTVGEVLSEKNKRLKNKPNQITLYIGTKEEDKKEEEEQNDSESESYCNSDELFEQLTKAQKVERIKVPKKEKPAPPEQHKNKAHKANAVQKPIIKPVEDDDEKSDEKPKKDTKNKPNKVSKNHFQPKIKKASESPIKKSTEDDDEEQPTQKKATKPNMKKATPPKRSESSEDEAYEDKKKKKARPPTKHISSDEEEDEAYEDKKKKKARPPTKHVSSDDEDEAYEDKKKKKAKPQVKRKSSDDEDEEEKPKPTKSGGREGRANYTFKYNGRKKLKNMEKKSTLKDNEETIKKMFNINDDEVTLSYFLINSDCDEEEIDAESETMNSLNKKVIIIKIKENSTKQTYVYQVNSNPEVHEIEIDPKEKVIVLKKKIAEINGVHNLSNIKILFAGKDLLNDIVLSTLNIGKKMMYVYIRSEKDILLMTANALKFTKGDLEEEDSDSD